MSSETELEMPTLIRDCLDDHIASRPYSDVVWLTSITVTKLIERTDANLINLTASGMARDTPFQFKASAGRSNKATTGVGASHGLVGALVGAVVSKVVGATLRGAVGASLKPNTDMQQCIEEVIAKFEEQLDKVGGYQAEPTVLRWKSASRWRWGILLMIYFVIAARFFFTAPDSPVHKTPRRIANLIGSSLGLSLMPILQVAVIAYCIQILVTPAEFFERTPTGRRLQAASVVKTPQQIKIVAAMILGLLAVLAAYFTLIDQLMLRLLPVRNPEQLVLIYATGPHMGSNRGSRASSPLG